MKKISLLLTRQLNISSSAAVCLPTARHQNAAVAPPTASFDNAVRRQAHGGLSVKNQNVRGFKNPLARRCGSYQGSQPFLPLVRKRHIHVPLLAASHALIKDILEALNSIYLVAGLILLGFSLLIPLSLAAAAPTLLVVGDSLSAGYGVTSESRWVDLLAQRLSSNCGPFEVVNASITGDTSSGGLARLPALLVKYDPRILIIELGGNDGLRGIGNREMRDNLQRMVQLAKQAGAAVLLLGVRLPANYGPDFVNAFHRVYYDVSEAESVPLVPFFLEGVALDPSLMQRDGIHPNDRAQPILRENVWSALQPLLVEAGLAPAACR
ncbi:MAG: arylesterase [Candidatus Thiodiazotropha sp. (ex Dulcina madagascariensis)]|nr:arylesterase [Candidatus Thiodiazotropha sp. (ex Dulcina madagascariensis)]